MNNSPLIVRPHNIVIINAPTPTKAICDVELHNGAGQAVQVLSLRLGKDGKPEIPTVTDADTGLERPLIDFLFEEDRLEFEAMLRAAYIAHRHA